MTRLAEMPAVAVFSCETCGTTRSIATSGSSPSTNVMSARHRGARGTARIVRFTIVYLAIITMTWALELSHMSALRQLAVVGIVLIAAGVFGGQLSPTDYRS